MSYSPRHYYRGKDTLQRGDPEKRVMGEELSDDFEAIESEFRRQSTIIEELHDDIKVADRTWQKIVASGFSCVKNTAYLVNIPTKNPYINLPKLGASDDGCFVMISDAGDGWSSSSDALTINLNGLLQDQAVGQLALDLNNVTVTFVWSGTSWWVYSSMSSSTAEGIGSDAPADGYIYGRKDNSWVQISSSGGGGGGAVEWVDVLNKPQTVKDLAAENASRMSIVSGGSY
jgi:hypothetical protein